MQSISTQLFGKSWQRFADVPRPDVDASGLPDNSAAVLAAYDEYGQAVIRTLVDMAQGALVRLDTEGYLVPNSRAIHTLERHGFDVQVIRLGPDRIIARVARDDRSLEVRW